VKNIFFFVGTLLESSIRTFSYIFMYVREKRGEFHEFHMVILLWLRPGYQNNLEFSGDSYIKLIIVITIINTHIPLFTLISQK